MIINVKRVDCVIMRHFRQPAFRAKRQKCERNNSVHPESEAEEKRKCICVHTHIYTHIFARERFMARRYPPAYTSSHRPLILPRAICFVILPYFIAAGLEGGEPFARLAEFYAIPAISLLRGGTNLLKIRDRARIKCGQTALWPDRTSSRNDNVSSPSRIAVGKH